MSGLLQQGVQRGRHMPLLAGSLRGVPSIPLYSPRFLVGRGGQGVMVVEAEYLQSTSLPSLTINSHELR